MMQTKEWYRSKTIWGGALALAAAVAGLFGVKVDAATGVDLASAVTDAAAAVGALVAIVGRLDAKSTIG
ncbi:hypothetical protein F6X38_10215 [Aureimonas leprariae]|uniref:Uncharacterized protein n=2 Tax=Plantimonas leprariae TaxID=2615207 RepID=A0A7V7TWK3_9HYPH|nr:hypothetical protein F6X38_10215 [Aureimonas leprariae]